MGQITRDNATIEYQTYGTGETTLLFVHGSFMDQEYWKDQVEFFSPEYRVVTLDLPGHGKSGRGREDWSVQGFAEDVASVIKEVGSDQVILIGHSLGGDINLIAATLHPQSIIGFIGIDNFKNAATPLPERYRGRTQAILDGLDTNFSATNEQYAVMALLTTATPPAIADRVVQAYRNAYRPMGRGIMPEVFGMYRLERELLPRLKPKLHLINVDYMPTDEAALRKHARNGFEVVKIPGTCHFPMLENPAALNAALVKVIGKIRKNVAVPA